MLIAMMNDTFVTEKADDLRQYRLIITWETILHKGRKSWQAPPPFNLLLVPRKVVKKMLWRLVAAVFTQSYKKLDEENKRPEKELAEVNELLAEAKAYWDENETERKERLRAAALSK